MDRVAEPVQNNFEQHSNVQQFRVPIFVGRMSEIQISQKSLQFHQVHRDDYKFPAIWYTTDPFPPLVDFSHYLEYIVPNDIKHEHTIHIETTHWPLNQVVMLKVHLPHER